VSETVNATRLGVLGWPVAHSRSPAMMQAALAAMGLAEEDLTKKEGPDRSRETLASGEHPRFGQPAGRLRHPLGGWRYQRLPVPPELFEHTTRALGGSGFRGANVTIPHKQAALALAEEASAAARAIGAANTLTFAPDGTVAAENTDAPGLIAAIERAGCGAPRGLTVQVLGAGGSARAAAWALREAGAREVTVWNRTAERAEQLGRELGVRTAALPEKADILINCTSVGLGDSLVRPAREGESGLNKLGLTHDLLGEYSYVVDLVYTQGPTPLLAAARAAGVPTLDGLEVLVGQGAISLEWWTGRPAPIEVMRRAAREAPADG
jgi:shikimate dehydrogenase